MCQRALMWLRCRWRFPGYRGGVDPTGASRRCWFAGLTTLDVIHRAHRRPGANEKITAGAQHVAAGGPAANAAVAAAALGGQALLITALGHGAPAQIARADLHAHGVDLLDAATDHELSVSAVLVLEATGERSVVSPDAGTPTLGEIRLANQPAPAAVLLDGHHPDLQRAVLSAAGGARIVLDAGRWREVFTELIPRADVVACSADFRPPGATGAFEDDLLARGARAVVVTDGAGDVRWVDGTGRGAVPVPTVPARDTLGAGDAFHGALTLSLAGGADLPEAVAEAVRVASIRVQWPGPRAYLSKL